jgi:excinuclease UvrABC ATPase subunit
LSAEALRGGDGGGGEIVAAGTPEDIVEREEFLSG